MAHNAGTVEAMAEVEVLAFYDANVNSRFDPDTEPVLGQAILARPLVVDEQTALEIDVSGVLPFRDAPISVWVDRREVLVELDEDNNVETSATFCLAEPAISRSFNPVLEWKWTVSEVVPDANQVLGTPAVIDLTEDGIPEVIFITFVKGQVGNAKLRAVDGRDGREVFTVIDEPYELSGYSELAVGDLDLDGYPEIVAVHESSHRLIAFEHDGAFKWRSSMLPYNVGTGGASLADLNRDGTPEVIIGNMALDNRGQMLWQGNQGRGAHPSTPFNAYGPLSLVVNLDMQGDPEVLGGNTAYRSDGTVYWHNADLLDGYNAIGNFDGDDYPEVVLVNQGQLYLLEHDGTVIWGPVAMPGGGRGGPPMVADVDGDGEVEIGLAGRSAYSVFETDGSLKWGAPIFDASSHYTSSSAFDFDGDGLVEVVHLDEQHLRAWRGTDGELLWEQPHASDTNYELPVVADVDGDGQAELIAVSSTRYTSGESGLHVYGDAPGRWMSTRPIWNQHTYYVTNIHDDGTIPVQEMPSWLQANTYRVNQAPDGRAADLSAAQFELLDHGTDESLSLQVRVGNGGLVEASEVAVAFYQGDPVSGGVRIGTAFVDALPGRRSVDLVLGDVALTGTDDLYAVIDPEGTVAECNRAKNTVTIPVGASPLGEVAVRSDTMSYGVSSPVRFTATVTNRGHFESDYTAHLHIEDADGNQVIIFESLPVVPLAGGASAALTQMWNSGHTLVSAYLLVATLLDPDGRELDRSTTVFTINAGEDALASLRLSTDRLDYPPTAMVRADSLVRNLTSNALLVGTAIEVQLINTRGTTMSTTTLKVGDVAAGGQRQVSTQLLLEGAPPGAYTLLATLRDDSGVGLAVAQSTLTIQAFPYLSVQGQVVAAQREVRVGQGQQCTETFDNLHTESLHAQRLRQLVVRLDEPATMTSWQSHVDLAPGGHHTAMRTIDTTDFASGPYACVLQAHLDDTWKTLDASVFTVTEADPPTPPTEPTPSPSEPDDVAPIAPIPDEPSPDDAVPDPAPVAVSLVAHADSAATRPGIAVAIPVLANDRDLANQRLSLTDVTQGRHGTVIFDHDSTFIYKPEPGFTGADAATYTVVNPQGETARQSVTIMVDHETPTATADRVSTDVDTPVTLPVLHNDHDPTGEMLSLTLVPPSTSQTTLNGGVITFDDRRTPGDPTDDMLHYAPAPSFAGLDTFTYQVSDPSGHTNTATVSIHVGSTAPRGVDLSLRVDPDLRTLAIDVLAEAHAPSDHTLYLHGVSQPAYGTVTLDDGRPPAEPSDASLIYTPEAGFSGVETLLY